MKKITKSGYPILDYMKKKGYKATRKNYLELAYPEGIPEITAEIEAGLPENLRK